MTTIQVTPVPPALLTISSSGIPIGIPSSGTIGNNGALSALTAFPQTYTDIYLYFPASAIVAGSAAGLYYCIMSSTTAGTVYNNTYSSGTPTIPASPTAFSTTGPGAYTQTIASNLNLASVTIGGNSMGINGLLEVLSSYSVPNNANAKTAGITFGTMTPLSMSLASVLTGNRLTLIQNRGKTNSQVNALPSGNTSGVGTTAAALTYGTVDTTADQSLIHNGNLGVATDYLVLERYSIQRA